MNKLNHCADQLDSHSLIGVKWIVKDSAKDGHGSKHTTQLMCEKCFRLFDHQEIVDFHMEHHGKHCETSGVGLTPVE